MIGQTLSHYRITAALGAGGMGEVYRATDSNLGRDVAIKVLPPEVAQDADRLSRFRREAQLLAALNHPNIAAIYGLEEANGKPFLALELVEGEDLKQRLARGAIPVDETLEIAEQIALALEEAHNKGIVHRDLKPANVKLTPDGKVKVLDFGLAKAWAGEASGVGSAPSALSQSPTLAHTGTIAGVILGTAAYMSPEQARGKPVDKRADVWSFGVLLWEMLTGRSLFAGDTVTDVIAAVVTKEPDLEALPPATPRAMRRLLSRCLRKDPRTRLPDMGAARIEIQDVRAGSAEEPGATAAGSDPTAAGEIRRLARQRWAWAAAFLLAAGLAGYLAASHFTETPEIRPAAHFVIEPPEGRRFIPWGAPAVSRDGRQVAFATAGAEASMPGTLWTRPLESVVSRELPGTEGAMLPFWSPDSRSLAFFTDSELRRISLDSGAAQKVCALPQGRFTAGGDWAEDGTILFSAGGDNARLYTVSASGGEAKPLTALDESRGEMAHWWPRLLPDGRHFLFQVRAKEPERQGLYVASLDEPQARRRLLPALTRADHQAGHLLFVRDETLLAQAFDVKRGSPAGEPSAVAFSVATWSASPGWGWFSTHRGELLAYLEGESRDSELVWFDRKGSRLGAVGKPGSHIALALSPDEKQAAVQAITPGAERSDIWTIDLARGVGTRQTSDTASESSPTWSADGREILFSSNREQTNRVYRKTLQGNEPETPFGKATEAIFPESVSPDGKELLYYARGTSGHTIGVLSLNGDKDPEPILEKPYPLDEPQLSPDGRWLAYGAQEAGRWEVYIEPYRRPGERVRVSPDGGGLPKWRGDGKELFYVTRADLLMAVEVKASSDRLEVGLPVRLFGGVQGSGTIDTYAVTRDGQRFLAIVPIGAAARGKIHVVTNWTSLLEKR